MARLFQCFGFAATMALVVGCGGEFKTAPVSGVITVDGQPLANASVVFTPEKEKLAIEVPISQGRTDENGRYTLKLIASDQKGAVIGKHQVVVSPIGEDNEDSDVDEAPPQELPDHDFQFTVKAGRNEANFDLKSGGGGA